MNTSTDFSNLAAELAALDAGTRGDSMLVARLLRHMTPGRWQKFCKAYPANQWVALPLSSLPAERIADLAAGSSRAAEDFAAVLSAEVLAGQLRRELIRIRRTGGALSLVGAAALPATGREDRAIQVRLTAFLAELLEERLEACDSLGATSRGHPVALLPGTGELASRHIAEQVQRAFAKRASSIGKDASCALGLITVSQGEQDDAARLIARVDAAIAAAIEGQKGRIHQIGPEAAGDRDTLVHSNEKRFLFFGGEVS